MKIRPTILPTPRFIKRAMRLGSPPGIKPEERHRRIPAIFILFAGIATMTVFPVYHMFSGHYWIATADIVALTGCIFALFRLSRSERGLVIYWMISIVFMGVCVITVAIGRKEISYFLWAFIPPSVFFSILGRRAGMTMSLFYFTVVLFLMTAPEAIMHSPPYSIFVLARYSVIYMLLTFMLYYYESSQQILLSHIRREKDKFEYASKRDPLTGLSNRRDLIDKIRKEQERQLRLKSAFTLILCDIDDFKALNDTHGHDAGDFVLQSVAQLLKDQVRGIDCPARWGGEEFLIMLIETDIESGKTVAERIRNKIRTAGLIYNGTPITVGMTFGVSQFHGTDDTIDSCIKRADKALYAGKHQGKNRVIAENGTPHTIRGDQA